MASHKWIKTKYCLHLPEVQTLQILWDLRRQYIRAQVDWWNSTGFGESFLGELFEYNSFPHCSAAISQHKQSTKNHSLQDAIEGVLYKLVVSHTRLSPSMRYVLKYYQLKCIPCTTYYFISGNVNHRTRSEFAVASAAIAAFAKYIIRC